MDIFQAEFQRDVTILSPVKKNTDYIRSKVKSS